MYILKNLQNNLLKLKKVSIFPIFVEILTNI